jgi:AbrB family looped-hinge helix DNA binding protein
MTFAATIDENGQITLPLELREQLNLAPNTQVEFEERDGVITMTKTQPDPPVDPEERARRIEAAIAKLRPAMRAAFVAEGWNSVEEYVNDMRGR